MNIVDAIKRPLYWSFFISTAINILFLGGPLFMLQVYDRVIPSQSIATLQALIILILAIYALQAGLEVTRGKLFTRISSYVNDSLSSAVFKADINSALTKSERAAENSFRDLETYQAFLRSGGPAVVFDIFWSPAYIVLLFLLHPYFGACSIAGILALVLIAWRTNSIIWSLQKENTSISTTAFHVASSAAREAETVRSLGMENNLYIQWQRFNSQSVTIQTRTADAASNYGGIGRFVRLSLQSSVLALGAWLVIDGKASPGVMIAASLLQGRALAPIELAISRWKEFTNYIQAYQRLNNLLRTSISKPDLLFSPPSPHKYLELCKIEITPPNCADPILREVNFRLIAGDALGIIGGSGSGKSTLARLLAGAWSASNGNIRFDDADLSQWSAREAGKFIGYLSQRVELFAGSIAQNIARFDEDATEADILRAAELANVDKLVKSLSAGYNTIIKNDGDTLSAGQRQRIGLARALYKNPFLVILDEPNSALDPEGEGALFRCMAGIRARGGIVVIITHRMNALQGVNKVLALKSGMQLAFGARDEMLKTLRT